MITPLVWIPLASMIDSLAIMVLTMVFPLWSLFSDKIEHLSPTVDWSSSAAIAFYLRVLPLWYLDGIVPLHHLLWIHVGAILPIGFAIPQVLGCRQPRTPLTFCSTTPSRLVMLLFDCIPLKPPDTMVVVILDIVAFAKCQLNLWCKTPSLPSMIYVIVGNILWLPANTTLVTYWLYLKFLATSERAPCTFLWSSGPTLTWNTLLMLPRSMTVVFRTSVEILEAPC